MWWNGASRCWFDGKSIETETNISVRWNKSKRAELWGSQSGIWVGMLTIWVKSFEIEFTKSISSIWICWHILLMDGKFSKDKHISRWVDRENLIYVRWNQKLCIKSKVINRRKRSKTLSEVKPVKNICKNLLSFLKISPRQKEVLVPHKLWDHAYKY